MSWEGDQHHKFQCPPRAYLLLHLQQTPSINLLQLTFTITCSNLLCNLPKSVATCSYLLLALPAIVQMNNEIIRSYSAFKILSFAKTKVTKNMLIIEMNQKNNDPKFFHSYKKIKPSVVCKKWYMFKKLNF